MTQFVDVEQSIIFDQNKHQNIGEIPQQEAREIGEIILSISQVVIDFASIERIPRYCKERRENNAEHSFMLALAGIEVVSTYYPGLDSGFAAKLALVHDLPELKTGDVATFDISDEQLQQKHADEKAGLIELLEELPPHLGDLLTIYEEQIVPEARLIRHLDKLLPHAVNITGAGMEVMNEDYNVTTVEQMLEKNDINELRFHRMFPEDAHHILHKAHTVLAAKFALTFDES